MSTYILSLWRPVVEIAILWFIFYVFLLFLKGTRAVQVLKGILILVVAFFVFQKLQLDTLNWVLTNLFAISMVAFLIIFQPELRYGLARIGQNPLFQFFPKEEVIEDIAQAAMILSKKKIGGLIALECEVSLRLYVESGVRLDSRVNSELITTIFMPNTPLHDGGIIIEGGRIVAAGCLFPLSQEPHISKTLGTRHRAAIGLTEETDAVVIVISEETGVVSIAMGGKLTPGLDRENLIKVMNNIYKKGEKEPGLNIQH